MQNSPISLVLQAAKSRKPCKSNLEIALDLVERGIPVFPCGQDKKPLVKQGFKAATRDPATIRRWWKRWPDALPAIPTGAASGFAVLDVDRKNGKDGYAELQSMGLSPEALSQATIRTPSGGLHIYFEHKTGLGSSTDVVLQGKKRLGLDIRAEGGYVIAPGARLPDGRSYGAWPVTPHADLLGEESLPPWSDVLAPPARPYDVPGDDEPEPVDWARVESALQTIDPDCNRDTWRNVGMALEQAGGDDAFRLWDEWSAGSKTKYPGNTELKKQWASFAKGRKGRSSAIRLGTLFELAHQSGWIDPKHEIADSEFEDFGPEDESAPPVVKRLNKKLAVVSVGGKVRIMVENRDGFELLTANDLHLMYDNERQPIQGTNRREPISKFWLRHGARREYLGGIVFRPNGAPRGAYNLFRGWSVEPDASASCDRYLEHLRNIVCAGSQEEFDWLLAWMAHLIQKPEEKPGTAVILKGVKGAGKDLVGRYFGQIFQRHRVSITQPAHLTGRFNDHLARALLIHMEEGFWAGDRAAESVLKNLITADRIQIEKKGVDPIEIDHFARLLITSNEEWVVPATLGERRFFVLDVAPDRAQDERYFANIEKEMRNGGPAALLHFLMNFNLDGFNVRKPPETTGLTNQKLDTMRNVDRWWYEKLFGGSLWFEVEDDLTDGTSWQDEPVIVSRGRLYSDYAEWMGRERYQGAKIRQDQFAKMWRQLCPIIAEPRPRVNGERVRQYEIPPLNLCRQHFEELYGAISWDE